MAKDKKETHPDENSQEIKVPQTPGEITEENLHLVDFDNLKVRLICLVSNPSQFNSTATFLERRGWEVFVTSQIKDALTQVGSFNPDFVLVSVNHPHKKIQQFPQILMQTFQVTTIAFGEQTDSKTMGAIQAARTSFKINGHLSGPMAQRKIKQILQDLYGQSEESSPSSSSMGQSEGSSLMYSSSSTTSEGNKKDNGGVMIFEKTKEEKGSSGYNPFTAGGGQSSFNQTTDRARGMAYDPTKSAEYGSSESDQRTSSKPISRAEKIQQEKEKAEQALKELGSDLETGNLDYGDVSENPKLEDPSYGSTKKNVPKFTQLEMKKPESKSSYKDQFESKKAQQGQFSLKQEKGSSSGAFQINPNQSDTSNPSHFPLGPSGEAQNHNSEHERAKGNSAREQSAYSRDQQASQNTFDSKKKDPHRVKLQELDSQSFIEKATVEIVNRMKAEEHENNPKMGLVRRMGLLSICHSKHKGYFMIADHEIGMSLDDFVEEFTKHFKKYCIEHGENVEFSDYVNMDCPSYDFFENSEEGLEFNLVTSFGAGEVAIKFINDEEAWADATTAENHEKALINAGQVVEDQPLDMDLFVHLKRNKKYYKIVGKDSELSKDRKDRLVEKKTDVFINQEDVGTYRRYQTKQKALRAINKSKDKSKKKVS